MPLLLDIVDVLIDTVVGEKLFSGTDIVDLAVVEDDDAVGILDGGDFLGDDDLGHMRKLGFQVFLEPVFRHAVESGEGVVEDENLRIAENGSGDTDSLSLSAGDVVSALGNIGVKAVLERVLDDIETAGDAAGFD